MNHAIPGTRALRLLALALLTLSQLSCASAGLTPATHAEPPERMGLAPEYRVFYDALKDQGDWVYVQPHGYVFRPNVNFITWRPYEDGYWTPSEIYGWTWISAEPFGWATYHYGSWLYDKYYGWVWQPGRDWGPAWVTWQVLGDYAGWSPIVTPMESYDQIPGGIWTYAPLSSLGSTNMTTRIAHAADLGRATSGGSLVKNLAERGGVVYNRGPNFGLVEKARGTFPRVSIEPLDPGPGRAGEAKPTASAAPGAAEKGPSPAAVESVHRAALESARRVRTLVERGGPPPTSVQVIQPTLPPPSATPPPAPPKGPAGAPAGGKGGPADTTAH
jgi:hypothetical protein